MLATTNFFYNRKLNIWGEINIRDEYNNYKKLNPFSIVIHAHVLLNRNDKVNDSSKIYQRILVLCY